MNLYVTGQVPKIILVAKSHGISPWKIFKRVSSRRCVLPHGMSRCMLRNAHAMLPCLVPTPYKPVDCRGRALKSKIARFFHLDVPFITPWTAIAIYRFRVTKGRKPRKGVPDAVLPVTVGQVADLYIGGVFPRATCFVHVDLDLLAICWAPAHYISLQTVIEVKQVRSKPQQSYFFRRTSASSLPSVDSLSSMPDKRRSSIVGAIASGVESLSNSKHRHAVHISYSSQGGVSRVLELQTALAEASKWTKGLQALLEMIPRTAPPEHWRWTTSCMAATSARGASGRLRRSELRFLVMCANGSSGLVSTTLDGALQSFAEDERQQGLPEWLRAAPTRDVRLRESLSVQHAAELLLRLSTSSQALANVYHHYAHDGRMSSDDWRNFVLTEQLAQHGTGGQDLAQDKAELEPPAHQGRLSQLQFAARLLAADNDAVAPALNANVRSSVVNLDEPIAHYWTACSHNSYCVGDQLTGTSTANAYRRQLLQVRGGVPSVTSERLTLICYTSAVRMSQTCRQVEIDCWDGHSKCIVTQYALTRDRTHGIAFGAAVCTL